MSRTHFPQLVSEYLSNEQHNRTELNTQAMENLFISIAISAFSPPLKVQIYKFFVQSCLISVPFSPFFLHSEPLQFPISKAVRRRITIIK